MNSTRESSRRKSRRALPRSHSSQPMIGLINAAILAIGLTVILASRCESERPSDVDSGAWFDSLITPKDLHLPESVTDRLHESQRSDERQHIIDQSRAAESERVFEESH